MKLARVLVFVSLVATFACSKPAPEPPTQTAPTAGALLREARQAKGLHIAALATAIKVAPRKLELLESDRFDELSCATFTRALAQTVCRSLKIDSAPVLALLPQAAIEHHRLSPEREVSRNNRAQVSPSHCRIRSR